MNGLKKMAYRARSLCFLLACSISSLHAEAIIEIEQQTTMPSIDFLEFLGEWETEQGDWVDPQTLEDNDLAQLLDTTEMKKKIDNEN